jgi:hypothetical protein
MLAKRNLKILLWLIAIHSFVVAIVLIVSTPDIFRFFGFEGTSGFFSFQGGVFHLVMVIAYIMSAIALKQESLLVWFCIAAKMLATVFLVLYFFICKPIWVVLLSGLGDFIMGLLLWIFFRLYKKDSNA